MIYDYRARGIDFRTVNIDDVMNKRGPLNTDRRFDGYVVARLPAGRRLCPNPRGYCCAYDDAISEGGMAVFKQEIAAASVS
jgi:hypothetical protein